MSPRTGRPKIANPKTERVTVRLDNKSSEILTQYCKQNNADKAEAIRKGICKLESELKK